MVGVIVDVRQSGNVHMHFQAPFHPFKGADGFFHRLRGNPVGEGDGCRRDAVLRVHPAGCAHADVFQDAARIVEVVVEAAQFVGPGGNGVEIGPGVCIMVGQKLRGGVFRRDGGAFFGDEGAACLRGEGFEGLNHVGIVAVDIQMVGIHGRNHGDLREQLQERAVELVGLGHDRRGVAHQEVAAVVAGNASQKGRASLAAFGEDVGGEGGCGGFPVGAGNRQAALAAGDLSQDAGALEQGIAAFRHFFQLSQVHRDGRGIDHQGVLHLVRDQVRPVLIVDGDAFPLQLGGELGRGAVVSAHLVTLEFVVTGQGAHSDSADADEINVVHISLSL